MSLRSRVKQFINDDELILMVAPDAIEYDSPVMSTILSTSANPLHKGHLSIMNYAQKKLNSFNGMFEISINNCDKGYISIDDLVERLNQFRKIGRYVFLTKCSTFVQKSIIMNECNFLVGSDTIERVLDKKYYFDSEEELENCLEIISINKCKFYVFNRNGSNLKNSDFIEYNGLINVFEDYVPIDISSTDIRQESKVE